MDVCLQYMSHESRIPLGKKIASVSHGSEVMSTNAVIYKCPQADAVHTKKTSSPFHGAWLKS